MTLKTTSLSVGFLLFVSFSFVGCSHVSPPPKKADLLIIDGPDTQPPPPPPPPKIEGSMVKIGIRIESKKISLNCDGRFLVKSAVSNQESRFEAGKYFITAKDNQIKIGNRSFSQKVWIRPESPIQPLMSNGRQYHGQFQALVIQGNKVNLINILTVDDYLKGVLPREVITSWPMEALKAQAVASRTYMVSHLGKHRKEGFDLCSEVHCQVYGGIAKENKRTSQAVEETRGEILVYEGKPINAFFHANCGGSTEKIQPVWGSPNKAYLPARKCPYGKGAPWYKWTLTMRDSEILSLLHKGTDVRGKKLKVFSVKKKSTSGRAQTLIVKTEKGKYILTGNQFRMALHPEKIRSTLWTLLRRLDRGYRFEGLGWGHGVGLCQWGAKGQADQKRSYKKIVKFYYPKTSLEQWKR